METTFKICTKCEIEKSIDKFYTNNHKSKKDKTNSHCKSCENERVLNRSRTKAGVISTIYSSQRASSRERNHKEPTYSLIELKEWLMSDWLFDLLYNNWKNCGYLKDMKPSLDRLDDSKGYSFDNIQAVSFLENRMKANYNAKNNILIHGHKKVIQKNINGEVVSRYNSISEASRTLAIDKNRISLCCNKHIKSYLGCLW